MTTPNQYDALGTTYDTTKTTPSSLCHESTLLAALGPVRSLRILDLACGSGDYARKLIALGAAHVTAIDLSPGMISAGTTHPQTSPKITYLVADCSKPLDEAIVAGSYDLVLGAWFLNYAKDAAEMRGMWGNVAGALRAGGRFVGLKPSWEPVECEGWYGHSRRVVGEVEGGFRRRHWLGMRKEVSFECYILEWDVYRLGAEGCGMEGLKVEPMVLPEGEADMEFWRPYLDRPTFEVISAVKP